MPVSIDPLGLQRVRRTDGSPQVTINGTGFSGAGNQVFIGGSSAAPIAESTTQITVDLPVPFSGDVFALRSIHVPVLVVNAVGETSAEAWIWIKGDLDEVADERIDTAVPGPFEVTGDDEVPNHFEARDMQRLASLVEALVLDIEPGNVLAWDGSKLAEPAGLKGSGAGQILKVDLSEATKLKWGTSLDAFLLFGREISAITGVLNAYAAGSGLAAPGTPGTENWALDDGTLDLVSFHGRASGGGTITRVRVLVNSVSQYDSGVISVTDFHQAISVAVTKGDKVQLELTPSGGGGHVVAAVGGVRLLLD